MLGSPSFVRRDLDHYPTPDWVSAAILPYLSRHLKTASSIWEPACGTGCMAEVLRRDHTVIATDIADYGYSNGICDFLKSGEPASVIVTNPPYNGAEIFIRHALKLTENKHGIVAMLLRNEYDSAVGRIDLFNKPPFARKIVLTRRPRWIPGTTVAPRHNYSWFLWDHRWTGEPVLNYHVEK
jgi:hypothetical protein